MAAMTIPRSIDFSRATASAICNSSSRLALTAIGLVSFVSAHVSAMRRCRLKIVLLRRRMRAALSCFLSFAFRGLAASQRFRDESVVEHEPGFRHVRDRQQHFGGLAGAVIAAKASSFALYADDQTTEAALSCHRYRHFNLRGMAGIAFEIRAPHQRAIDTRRGDFQAVGPLDRIGNIEYGRECPRDIFAILDAHRPVRALCHDLNGAARHARNPHADQSITQAGNHWLRYGSHARCNALLYKEARFVVHSGFNRCGHRSCRRCLLSKQCPGRSPNRGLNAVTKKSGSRGNPLSKTDRITSDRYEMSI